MTDLVNPLNPSIVLRSVENVACHCGSRGQAQRHRSGRGHEGAGRGRAGAARGTHVRGVAGGVGGLLGAVQVAGALPDAVGVHVVVDAPVAVVGGGVDQRLRDRRAVPVAFDQQRATVFGLHTQLVVAVVAAQLVPQGAGGQLEGTNRR